MDIRDFKNKHTGETCVIIGNGPSLNDSPVAKLMDKYVCFGTNRFYLKGPMPDYYVSVNDTLAQQFGEEMCEKVGVPLFVPRRNEGYFQAENVVTLDTSQSQPGFFSPEYPMWEGHTVTYVCMQLAHYMGFDEVILIGVDHYFDAKGPANKTIVSTGRDTNHFHPDYFGPGIKWDLPDLAMSELAYSMAKNVFGGRIYNASARTALKTFPLMNVWRAFDDERPLVSAIVSAYKTVGNQLWHCLEDLDNQSVPCEKVVVYQAGSREHDIIEQWDDDPYLVRVMTPDIPTVYQAWNKGIKVASGKYITNANTDDQHHPRAFQVMSAILEANDHLDLVYANTYVTWEYEPYDEFVARAKKTGLAPGRIEGKDGIFLWLDYNKGSLVDGCYIGPQPMWRHSLHQRYGMFSEEMKVAGDYDFWLRCRGDDNYFHITAPLGLYLARKEGREMKNQPLTKHETIQAIVGNMEPGLSLTPFQEHHVMIKVGGEYCTVAWEPLNDLVQKHKR